MIISFELSASIASFDTLSAYHLEGKLYSFGFLI